MIPTTEWAKLDPNSRWQDCYPVVEAAAKRILDDPVTGTMTTVELADRLLPEQYAVGTKRKARVFKALEALAEHGLFEYWTAGPAKFHPRLKRNIRPKLWHGRKPKERRCPTCNQIIKEQEAHARTSQN